MKITILLFIFLLSCTNYNNLENKIIINNISNSPVIISVCASSDVQSTSKVTDINKSAIYSRTILANESFSFPLPNEKYIIFYGYDDYWGALTKNGNIEVIEINNNDVTIQINKRGWVFL